MNVGRFLLKVKELVLLLEVGPVIGSGTGRIDLSLYCCAFRLYRLSPTSK